MRVAPMLFGLTPILALAASCASDTRSASQWDGSVRDSAGITIVENQGEPVWEPGQEWHLVEELRVGMREGPPEYQFGRITGFGPLSDGRIVVADAMASEIRFYSPEGEHLRSVGKRGSGPREFGEGFLDLLRGFGDTLLVVDYRNQQTHRLAPDGTWLGSFSIRPEDNWRVSGWDTAPSGLIINVFTPLRLPDTPLPDTMDIVVVRHLNGSLGDTLGRVPTAQNFRFRGDTPELRFYAGIPDFDLRWDGGLITGRSDTYELTWRLPDGVPERIVRLHREPIAFTANEQSMLMDRLVQILKNANQSPEQIAQMRNSVVFEDFYPYYRRFMNGPTGTLWVRQVLPIREMTGEEIEALNFSPRVRPGPSWEVFDGEGRYLGTVGVPPGMTTGLLHGDRMFGVVRDEFDVQYLQIYRIEGRNRT